MKRFNLKTVVEHKTPKTKITRLYPVKNLPLKKRFGDECAVGRYIIKHLFQPWFDSNIYVGDVLNGEPKIYHAFPKENIMVESQGKIFTRNKKEWKLNYDGRWNDAEAGGYGLGDTFYWWPKSPITKKIREISSITLDTVIGPAEIKEFDSKEGVRYKSSDVLEKKYDVSITFNDHETRNSLELAAESIYLRKSVKDIHNSNKNYFEFDDNALTIHILNPTPKRVSKAVKSYIPVNDYFVNKFPVFMEAAQLIEQGLQLQEFIERSFGRAMESYIFFKIRYHKVSKRNIEYFEKIRDQFFQEADKRLKGLKFPETGLEKYLKI